MWYTSASVSREERSPMTAITLEVPRVVIPVPEDCYTAGQIVAF